MADHPLRPATDRRLGKPLPHQLANRTSAAPATRGRFRSPAFLSRAYAVLAWLSPGYPPPQDTFRCITHPFATRRQGCPRVTVRLACVKHAASVQSEPGSNSSVQSLKLASIFKLIPSPYRTRNEPHNRASTCSTIRLALMHQKPKSPQISNARVLQPQAKAKRPHLSTV